MKLDKPLYTIDEATKALGLPSGQTLYVAKRGGHLRTITICGRLYLPREGIERLLTQGDGSECTRGKAKPPAPPAKASTKAAKVAKPATVDA